jgi:hypothetical protein
MSDTPDTIALLAIVFVPMLVEARRAIATNAFSGRGAASSRRAMSTRRCASPIRPCFSR